MTVEVLLVREGPKLAAADPLSAEIIAELAHRETYTATIKRPRNPKHHKKLFALLKVVFEAQSTFATLEQLLGALKLAIGLFDTGMTIDRVPYVVPRSISFASMSQDEFAVVYDKMIEVILTRILPASSKVDLERQVHEILDGYVR
jgi:hypothetical protein